MARLRKDERLSWPRWLTFSGQFTYNVVTCQLSVGRRTGKLRQCRLRSSQLSYATMQLLHLLDIGLIRYLRRPWEILSACFA